MFFYYISVFIAAFLTTLIITPLTINLARQLRLLDNKNIRRHPAHTHKGTIPRAGGVPIYAGILLATLFFIPLNKVVIGMLLGGFLITILGFFDDKYDLSPYLRFFLNIVVAGITIMFGLGIPYIGNPFDGVIRLDTLVWTVNLFGTHNILVIADTFAIIWLVALMNFVNWSKGIDGQMPGF